jgi:hypothetical protein
MAIQIQGKVVRLPDGSEAGPYEIVSGLTSAQEFALIQGGDAIAAGARNLAPAFFDVSGASPVLLNPNGTPASVSGGGLPLTSGAWAGVPSIFRLRLIGTGTVTVDAQDRLGAITTGVASYSPSAATNQIEYPYLGDGATQIRATLTGTAAAEVI